MADPAPRPNRRPPTLGALSLPSIFPAMATIVRQFGAQGMTAPSSQFEEDGGQGTLAVVRP
jgi:hypothetical protein